MIALPSATRIYVACGVSGMRRRFDGLCAQIEGTLKLDPYGGAVFIFRGKRGDLIKALHWDGQGLVLYSKRRSKTSCLEMVVWHHWYPVTTLSRVRCGREAPCRWPISQTTTNI